MGTGRQPSASNPYVSRKREVGKLDGGNRHLWSDPIPCLLSGGIREDAAHFCPYAFMACVPFGIVGYSWCLKPQTLFMPHCAVGMRPVGAVFTRTCAAFTGGFLLFVLGSKEKGLPLGVDCGLLWMCSGQKLPRGSSQLRHSGIGEWRSSLVVLRHHSETGARPPPMGPPTLENPGTIF